MRKVSIKKLACLWKTDPAHLSQNLKRLMFERQITREEALLYYLRKKQSGSKRELRRGLKRDLRRLTEDKKAIREFLKETYSFPEDMWQAFKMVEAFGTYRHELWGKDQKGNWWVVVWVISRPWSFFPRNGPYRARKSEQIYNTHSLSIDEGREIIQEAQILFKNL